MNAIRQFPVIFIVLALVAGVLIGRSPLFDYSSAEDCVIHAKTPYAIGACYDLYPRAADKR